MTEQNREPEHAIRRLEMEAVLARVSGYGSRYPTEILHGDLKNMNLLQTFGLGRLPPEADFLIPPHSRKITCEHVSGTLTFRNFRSPGRFCNWKRQWFAGSIAVSDKRIITYRWSKRLINTVFDDPRFSGLSFTADDDMLMISHDASLYRSDWSGILEYRLRTPEAGRIADAVRNFVPQPMAAIS